MSSDTFVLNLLIDENAHFPVKLSNGPSISSSDIDSFFFIVFFVEKFQFIKLLEINILPIIISTDSSLTSDLVHHGR